MNVHYPKIVSVKPLEDYQLMVEFSNQECRYYDVKPLLENEIFVPLRNKYLFNHVKIEQGGYAISWNEEIDISEYELWKNGKQL